MSRPSPTESATLFKVGERRMGNDGNIWEIMETKNGVKRWRKVTGSSKVSRKTSRQTSRKTGRKKVSRKVSKNRVSQKISKKKRVSRKKRSRTKSKKKSSHNKKVSRKKRTRTKSKNKVSRKRKRKVGTRGATGKRDRMVKDRQIELTGVKCTKSYVTKSKLIKPRIYMINDNLTRPFKVVVSKNKISVNRQKKGSWDIKRPYDQLVKKFTKYMGLWVGYDSSIYKFHGNSILIKVSKNKYVYIGERIYEFKTTDEIMDYVSPIGGNNVPYPVAFGQKNVYFMPNQQYIKNEELETEISVKGAAGLSDEFYGRLGSKFYERPIKHKKIGMKGVKKT